MASNTKPTFNNKALGFLLEELYEVRSKWYYLGLQLQLSTSDLNDIKKVKKDKPMECLLELLSKWFETKNATCESLLKALKSKTMNSHSIAERIQVEFQTQQNIPESTTQGLEASGSNNNSEETFKRKRCLSSSTAGTPKSKRKKGSLPDSFHQTDFAQKQPPDRLCVKCTDRVPLNPQRSVCCNRLYCKPCADKTKKCSDRQHKEPMVYKPDKELSIRVYKLTVKCLNWKEGCKWKGEVFRLRNHISECTGSNKDVEKLTVEQDENDEMEEVSAKPTNIVGHIPPSFADEDFATKQLDENHCVNCKRVPSTPLRSECCNGLYCETCSKKCTHCPVHGQAYTFKTDKPLKKAIQSYRVKCPHMCGWKDKMYKLKQHLPTHTSGDSEPSEEISIEQDLSHDGNELGNSTEQAAQENVSEETKQDQDQSMKINSTNGVEEDIEQSMTLDSPSTTESLKEQVEALSILNYQLQTKLDQIQQENETCDLRTPPLSFHVPLLSSYQSLNIPWRSPSFYTHQLGYRVNLLIQVDGTGALCIGLAPEKGVNDDHLRWPVSGKMDIQLLNQNADCDHSNITTKFELAVEQNPIKLKIVRIPTVAESSYTSGDSLYFRLVDIKLEENAKPWLIS